MPGRADRRSGESVPYERNGKSMRKVKWGIQIELVLLAAVGCVCLLRRIQTDTGPADLAIEESGENKEAIEVSTDGGFIKWVDFNVTCEAMSKAYELDVASRQEKNRVNWIELLAYTGARHGGKFDKNCVAELQQTGEKLQSGETTMRKLTKDMEYYDYYEEAYRAVLDGMVGEYSLEVPKGDSGETEWKDYYGLKAFSPIAKGFEYSHYDDFGSSRSYGYARPHLGHDMMGQIGTPIRIIYRICALKQDAQTIFI